MTRAKAFGIHLATSMAIFAVVSGLLIFVWYPSPLFELEDGWQGLELVALVDVVLGPALTLVVFKPAKAGLKFDMTIIAIFQLSALIYGVWNLYAARPVLLVHAYDHIQPLTGAALAEWDPSGSVLKRWEGVTPKVLHVRLPDDPIEFAEVYLAASANTGSVHALFDRYQTLEEGWTQMLQDATDMENYLSRNPAWRDRYDALLARLGRKPDQLVFFGYVGRKERAFLVFDREDREILGALHVPFDPGLAKPVVPRLKRESGQ